MLTRITAVEARLFFREPGVWLLTILLPTIVLVVVGSLFGDRGGPRARRSPLDRHLRAIDGRHDPRHPRREHAAGPPREVPREGRPPPAVDDARGPVVAADRPAHRQHGRRGRQRGHPHRGRERRVRDPVPAGPARVRRGVRARHVGAVRPGPPGRRRGAHPGHGHAPCSCRCSPSSCSSVGYTCRDRCCPTS